MTPSTPEHNLALTVAYYNAMNKKDLIGVEKYLHSNVECKGAMTHVTGKNEVMQVIKEFFGLFKSLTIQEKFSSGDKVMVVYDLDCSEPIGIVRIAALMTFKGDLITKFELFYDPRPFGAK